MRDAVAAAVLSIALVACATGPERGRSSGTAADLAPALGAHARGDVDGTLELLAPLLAEEPWHVPAHRLRQDALRAAGRADEARRLYLEAAEARPDDARRALLAARVTARAQGARLAAYRRALTLDPEGGWPRAALASELLAAAEQLARDATSRRDAGFPDDAAVLEARRDAHLAEAAALAAEAVRRDADLAAAHEAHADALTARAEAGRGVRAELLELAVVARERAVRLSPGDPRPLARLAALRHRAGDDDGAAEAYRSALELDPEDAVLLTGLGRAELYRGDAVAAVAALAEAAEARPDDPFLLLDLGVAQQRSGDLDAAVESLRQAVALAPDDPRALRALALVVEERERAAEGAR